MGTKKEKICHDSIRVALSFLTKDSADISLFPGLPG